MVSWCHGVMVLWCYGACVVVLRVLRGVAKCSAQRVIAVSDRDCVAALRDVLCDSPRRVHVTCCVVCHVCAMARICVLTTRVAHNVYD